jgi:hypothetical protein
MVICIVVTMFRLVSPSVPSKSNMISFMLMLETGIAGSLGK